MSVINQMLRDLDKQQGKISPAVVPQKPSLPRPPAARFKSGWMLLAAVSLAAVVLLANPDETLTPQILIGAAFLVYTRIASWRIMLSVLLGMVATVSVFNLAERGSKLNDPMNTRAPSIAVCSSQPSAVAGLISTISGGSGSAMRSAIASAIVRAAKYWLSA